MSDWAQIEALKKCERCGEKASTAYLAPADDNKKFSIDNFKVLSVVCDPCLDYYNQMILAMTAPMRANCPPDCEDCKEMNERYSKVKNQ